MSSENSGTQSTNPNQAIRGLIPVEVGCNLYAMLHEIPPFWLVSGIRGSCGKVRYVYFCNIHLSNVENNAPYPDEVWLKTRLPGQEEPQF